MSKKCKQTLKSFFPWKCNANLQWLLLKVEESRRYLEQDFYFGLDLISWVCLCLPKYKQYSCKTPEFELSWIRIRFKFEFHLNFPWNQFHEKFHEIDFTEKFELPWLFGLLWEKDLIVHEVLHFLWQFHHQLVKIWNVHLVPCSYQKHQNDLFLKM